MSVKETIGDEDLSPIGIYDLEYLFFCITWEQAYSILVDASVIEESRPEIIS